jgi:regulator of cell morphogenesis and NO signaling
MQITRTTPVAAVASGQPGTIKVFERHGIDFCCGGQRPLGEACAEKGLAFEGLAGELEAAMAAPGAERSWQDAPLVELIAWIESRFHARLREDMPGLSRMAEKVAAVHGERHPEVREIASVYAALRAELEAHLVKEEQVLFPFVGLLAEGRAAGHPLLGMIRGPIGAMEAEHESAGAALTRLRELSRGYAPPEDACNTFRGLYHGLAELERELHEHIHLENNVLHPRARALETQVLG